MARLATPAPHRPARAPGRLKAGEELAHTASVAHSVARSHARAHQSSERPRAAAVACAAAKVSQTGPQRRNIASASGDGSSWPSTFNV